MRQDSLRNTECHWTLIDGERDSFNGDVETCTYHSSVTSSHRRSMSSSVMTSDNATITHSRPTSSVSRYLRPSVLYFSPYLRSVPGARDLSRYVTSHSGQLNLAIPPWVLGRRNEYHPKSDDALRLGSKGRCGSCVGGR